MTLTDPAYVRSGATWPPVSEKARIRRAEDNLRLYRGDFSLLDATPPDATQLRFQAANGVPQRRITVNSFRWISKLWSDLVFGAPPVLDYLDVGEAEADSVLRRLKLVTPSLVKAGRALVKDCIRYGCGVFICRRPGMVEIVDPRFWFPLTAPDDLNDVRGHIIAYPFISDPNSLRIDGTTPRGTARAVGSSTPDRVRVHRFLMDMEGVWTCQSATFHYDGSSLGTMLGDWEAMPCAQPPVTKVQLEGDDIYGESIFDDLRSHVTEINRRETSLSEALDKHADPHLAVPEGSLQVDAQGRVILNKKGMAIFVPDGASNPEYIVWDPKFDAHVAAILRAERRIVSLGAISQILVNTGASDESNRIYLPSGVALRRLALTTVQRILAYRSDLEEPMQMIVRGALSDQFALESDRINIGWPPPLDNNGPDDTDELVSLIEAGVIDRVAAAQQVAQVPRREAERIVAEAMPVEPRPAAMPMQEPNGDA